MKTTTQWWLCAILVPAAVLGPLAILLLYTSLGNGMPYGVKVGGPAFMYVAYVAFLVAHKGDYGA